MYTPKPIPTAYTVSQINAYVANMIGTDPALRNIFVQGELSNVNINMKSGHMYFTLKDKNSVIRAVMFAWSVRNLKFRPEDGMKVILRAQVTVYEPSGQYQLRVEEMQPDGVGVLAMQLEQLKKKLEAQGLFAPEHKKPIPSVPKTVGVITSPTGAALRDILNIIGRRFPCAEVVLAPVQVQGEEAPAQLIDAIRTFSDYKAADVIIIGRGGGSMENLWAFNDERLASAIYDCSIPVISAVGHETDFTICDFVSDLRAPTPSAAAELAVPNAADLMSAADALFRRGRSAIYHSVRLIDITLEKNDKLIEAYSPSFAIDKYYHLIETLSARMARSVEERYNADAARLKELKAKLEELDPAAVLKRGFSYIVNGDRYASSVNDVKKGDRVEIVFADGKVEAEIV